MIYLDDIAAEIESSKYRKIRNIACIILFFVMVLKIIMIAGTYVIQNDAIERNRIEISEYNNKLAALEKEFEEYKDNYSYEFYDVTEIGDRVAEIQSSFGGFRSDADLSDISESTRTAASEMDYYLYSKDGRTAWYQNVTCKYQWYYLMRQTSLIGNIPCIWVCKSAEKGKVLAVTTGTCDAKTERFGDFRHYYTTQGQALITEDAVISVSGVIESDVDYEAYYESIMEIQAAVGRNAYERTDDTEAASDGNEKDNTNIGETGE